MSGARTRGSVVVALVSALALAAAPANAATVGNGDFEAGNLGGWTVSDSNAGGTWFAYSGTDSPWEKAHPFPPIEPEEKIALRQVPAPPQGTFAALADQEGPGRHILYQDIALEPGQTHSLSMTVYYDSNAPLANPSPDSLDPGEPEGGEVMLQAEPLPNQQYRVEVIKPSAPLDTVNPEDILASVFRTSNGSPQELGPTTVTADLSALAGQTVRLRLVEVDNQANFAAGADAVAITSVPLNTFRFGRFKLNRKKGTGKLTVTVPGPGKLVLDDVPRRKGGRPNKLRKGAKTAKAAGKVVLPVKPSGKGRKSLLKKLKLAFRAQVTFTPTGGTAGAQVYGGKLRLKRAVR
jgi:hypothetical protein